MDIIFLSYEEPSAERNFAILQERFPRAKRLHGVNGLGRAHRLTAQMADSNYYFIVDGDNEILPSFNFDAVETPKHFDIKIWQSINPVNGLKYGNGGVKLCSKEIMLNKHNHNSMDYIASGKNKVIFETETASITKINTSPFSAWRAGFRECAKLASPPEISGLTAAPDHWKKRMISIWTSVGRDHQYGDWVIRGAKDGIKYASLNMANSQNLLQINSEEWLRNYFNSKYGMLSKPSQKFVP